MATELDAWKYDQLNKVDEWTKISDSISLGSKLGRALPLLDGYRHGQMSKFTRRMPKPELTVWKA